MKGWIYAVILIAVLLIVGLIVWLALRGHASGKSGAFDEPCNTTATPVCDTGLTCVSKVCKRSNGVSCASSSDCASGICTGKLCAGATGTGGLNQPCGTTGCNAGLTCNSSNICKSNTGSGCTGNSDCFAGTCLSNKICGTTGSGQLGQSCTTSCSNGLSCSGGFCQFGANPTGSPYSYCSTSGAQCGSNLLCRSNVCLPTTGGFNSACSTLVPCNAPAECNTTAGLCLYRSPPGVCGDSNNCPSGIGCTGGICVLPTQGGCFSGNQCVSQICNFTTGSIQRTDGLTSVIDNLIPVGVQFNRILYYYQGVIFTMSKNVLGLYEGGRGAGISLIPNTGNWTNGATTYQLIDAAMSGAEIVNNFSILTIYNVVQNGTNLGTGLFLLNQNITGTTITPIGGGNGLVMFTGAQYDPVEVDYNGEDIIISAVPHASPSASRQILVLPRGTLTWLAPTGLVAGSQMKPRFYPSPSPNSWFEFSYQIGNIIYLFGTLSPLSYRPAGQILDYNLDPTSVYPMIAIGANIATSATGPYSLVTGLFGFGPGLINPIFGFPNSSTLVQLNKGLLVYTTVGMCS